MLRLARYGILGSAVRNSGWIVGDSEKARSGFPREMPIPATWPGNTLPVEVLFLCSSEGEYLTAKSDLATQKGLF
jgi:hypothetical protein